MATHPLERFQIPLPIRLSALWAASLCCYIYGDLLSHWLPGAQERLTSGDMGPLGIVTPGLLAGIAVVMAVPSVMIAASVLLPPVWSRWLNLVLGVIYTLLMAGTIPAGPLYYKVLGAIEVALTGTIAWLAWRWPREAAG